MAKSNEVATEVVAEEGPWFNPNTHHEVDMPKVVDGRKVVKVKSDNEAGFRYAMEDELRKGDEVIEAEGWGE